MTATQASYEAKKFGIAKKFGTSFCTDRMVRASSRQARILAFC
jgi:hypothetical protein